MKEVDELQIKGWISGHIHDHRRSEHLICTFDCPNCGHLTAAVMTYYDPDRIVIWSSTAEPPHRKCLSCGKIFSPLNKITYEEMDAVKQETKS